MVFESGRYGWSESFYDDRHETADAAVAAAIVPGGLCTARAALLGEFNHLVSVRASAVGGVRHSTRAFSPGDFPGEGTFPADESGANEGLVEEPFTAAFLYINCNDDKQRPYLMRGVPDAIVGPQGALVRNPEWFGRLYRYYRVLRSGSINGTVPATGYSMRSVGSSTDVRPINAADFVSAEGRVALFTTTTAFNDPGEAFAKAFIIRGTPPAPGWIGTFRGVFNSAARLSVTLYASRQLASGPVAGGGTIAPLRYTYHKIQDATIQSIRKRDTGRPSGGPRGRSSKGRYLR